MKKYLLFLLALSCLCVGCDNRTAEQRANDALKAQEQAEEKQGMEHEKYIDSLVNVASGLEGETLVRNRQNALNILRKEYPELNDKWDSVQESIDNMEIY